ncbi:hypothetical protein LPJ61_002283 [Coemansia biformis]|uniref:Mate-domain-containing protein n=1 Tax=Coemansia biformis TaxID=1286918 RepID=A0A9W7YEE1_9FUNG|nr:hypothetical protein LPJ61_002283 [Coemansia biformis]
MDSRQQRLRRGPAVPPGCPAAQLRTGDDGSTCGEWSREARDLAAKAVPMVVAGTIRSLTSIIQVQALSHFGTKPLAGYALALLIVNLTGYPFMYGLGGALESLCSQAFTGAHGRRYIGVYVQHSIWLFLVANVAIVLLWLHPGGIFRLLAKTDPEVLRYARTLLAFECVPCGISGIASYGFADLATVAVAMLGADALALQAVLNLSKSAVSRTGSYLGMAVSNRVGNLLGARNPAGAALAAKVSITVTAAIAGLLAILMAIFQHEFALFIAKDRSLESGLLPLLPLLAVVIVFDMLSNVLTGVLRGQGRQGVAALIRVISLYVLAIPLAYVLCFSLHMGLRGLWIGLAAGFATITAAETWLVYTSDWHGEVKRAIERVHGNDALPSVVDSPLQESTALLHPG